jgi:hypothetical protein
MNRVVTTVGCIVVSVVLTACGSDDQPDLNQNTLETVQSSRQDAYGLMDGRITWLFANGSTSLSLWGRNILDKEYFPSAIDLSSGLSPEDRQFVDGVGQPSGTNTKYWGEPRRVGLELRHIFN